MNSYDVRQIDRGDILLDEECGLLSKSFCRHYYISPPALIHGMPL